MNQIPDPEKGNEDIERLIKTLSGQLPPGRLDPTGTVAVLISETVKFRDRLKMEAGSVLTVEDTRMALDALQASLTGRQAPRLTPTQTELARIYTEKLVDFGRS